MRHDTLQEAFLFEGFQIGGEPIYPLSMTRQIFLKRLGNQVILGSSEDEEEIAEVMFSCATKTSELAPYLKDRQAFRDAAVEFAMTADEGALEAFTAEIVAEVERLKLAQVEPVRGKRGAQAQASPQPSPPTPAGSD